ncbi:hypothetical protein GCM10009789_82470 [Kribbella sancticallisti]|uniref:Uncharacterized protein n=1 Tax=Kribbella sancticallisti TaxID=460087 RepID=A0ABP4QM81_9ACTN
MLMQLQVLAADPAYADLAYAELAILAVGRPLAVTARRLIAAAASGDQL